MVELMTFAFGFVLGAGACLTIWLALRDRSHEVLAERICTVKPGDEEAAPEALQGEPVLLSIAGRKHRTPWRKIRAAYEAEHSVTRKNVEDRIANLEELGL